MDILELERWYEKALRPAFGERFQIQHDRDDFVTVMLDEEEDFFFTLYGIDHVRLYWCNECFLFDGRREELTSSDTYGEIVYEGKIDAPALPQMVADLALYLKDCVFLRKEETVTGRLPSGYDVTKDYKIQAGRNGTGKTAPYKLGNLQIEIVPESEAGPR